MWCHQESNRGHMDFQSIALPTELWHLLFGLQIYISNLSKQNFILKKSLLITMFIIIQFKNEDMYLVKSILQGIIYGILLESFQSFPGISFDFHYIACSSSSLSLIR
jgi:hypothetical protein